MYTFICSRTRVYLRFDESKSSKRPGFANTAQYSMTLNCVHYNTITARSSSKSLPSRCDAYLDQSRTYPAGGLGVCDYDVYNYYFLFEHE